MIYFAWIIMVALIVSAIVFVAAVIRVYKDHGKYPCDRCNELHTEEELEVYDCKVHGIEYYCYKCLLEEVANRG